MSDTTAPIPFYETIVHASAPAYWTERAKLVTASKMAAILGRNPYRSALEQYLVDAGLKAEEDAGEAAEWGQRLEETVAKAYGEKTGREVELAGVLLRSTRYPWMGATLDAWAREESAGVGVPLEVKTCGAHRGDDWSEGVPTYYQPQIAVQMIVTGCDAVAVACLIGGQKLVWTTVKRADIEPLIAECIAASEDFARRVRESDPPLADGSESAQSALLTMFPREEPGKTVLLTPEHADATVRIAEIAEQIKALDLERDLLKQTIEQAIGDAERGVLPGGERAWRWATVERREHTVKASSSRQLRNVKL